jgi:4-amino-4-deoxy-L-arabinose transferase-like glycosyltransferase
MSTPLSPLKRGEYLLLFVYCLLLFLFPVFFNRPFSTHETSHVVPIQEMRQDRDWIIPHYGGRPWLERPPLPFWLTVPLLEVFGDIPAVYRLAPVPIAISCVLLGAWMAALWFGRTIGLLAGLILATMREFTYYAPMPQCDMFLCGLVTYALSAFVYLEFRCRPADGESGSLVGPRPWLVVVFFAFLGLTNLTKGLFFGDMQILLPVAAFLLLGADRWSLIKRYVWLPGWLVFAVVGAAWAAAAWSRYPDIVDLWRSDYLGRYNQGYMREPIWYYLIELPWILFPWTIAALVGLALTWRRVLSEGRTPERFLWCWAIAPIAFLSIPQGKHHHYLLHCMPAWAILTALGTVRLLQWLPTIAWMRTPWPTLVAIGFPGQAALIVLDQKYHPPEWFLLTALIVWPLLILVGWAIAVQPDLRKACIALFALLIPGHWLGHALPPLLNNRYANDLALVAQVKAHVPAHVPVLVGEDIGPLDASWWLYYLDGRAEQLHNFSFLRDQRYRDGEVYVIARRMLAERLREYGSTDVVLESDRSRDEGGPEHRFALYRLRFHDRLARCDGRVYISPMQATGRAPGPDLRGP